MDNLVTLCFIGMLFLLALFILPRIMGSGFGGRDYTQRGPEYPRYDDPNIRSRGSFGGWFGRGRSSGGSRSAPRGRVDSPRIRSRGGFGRSKD